MPKKYIMLKIEQKSYMHVGPKGLVIKTNVFMAHICRDVINSVEHSGK
jgi:hypothetical protein